MELIKHKYSERKKMILNNEAKAQLARRKIYHRLSMSLEYFSNCFISVKNSQCVQP